MPLPENFEEQLADTHARFVLRRLGLSNGRINQEGSLSEFKKQIQDHMRTAIEIDLHEVTLPLRALRIIAESAKKSKFLQSLTLYRCTCEDNQTQVANTIADIIEHCSSLTEVNLKYSFFFSVENLQKIATAISKSTTLTSLTLSVNYDKCVESLNALTAATQNHPSLNEVSLTNLHMTKTEIDALAIFFGANKNLRNISLSEMMDCDEDELVKMLIAFIKASNSIERISINHSFSAGSMRLLESALHESKSLHMIHTAGDTHIYGVYGNQDNEIAKINNNAIVALNKLLDEEDSEPVSSAIEKAINRLPWLIDDSDDTKIRCLNKQLNYFLTTNQIGAYASLLAKHFYTLPRGNESSRLLALSHWALMNLEDENNSLPIGHIIALIYTQFTEGNNDKTVFLNRLAAGIVAASKGININSLEYHSVTDKENTYLFTDAEFIIASSSQLFMFLNYTLKLYAEIITDKDYTALRSLQATAKYLTPSELLELTNYAPLKEALIQEFRTNNIILIDHLVIFPTHFPLKAPDTKPRELSELAKIAKNNMMHANQGSVLNDVFAAFITAMPTNEHLLRRELAEAEASAAPRLAAENVDGLAALTQLLMNDNVFDMSKNKQRLREIVALREIRDHLVNNPAAEYATIKKIAEKAVKTLHLTFSYSAATSTAEESSGEAKKLLLAMAASNSYSGLGDCGEFRGLTTPSRKTMPK